MKATNQANDQDSAKKKEVNWQASVEKEAEANNEPADATGVMRQESLQRKDSNVGKADGAGQTGTAKRKKKKKEEVTGYNF